MSIYRPIGRSSYRVFGSRGGGGIPKAGLLFYAKAPGLVDTIGLSVADYAKLGPIVQAIVSADGGTTLRTTAEIVALMAASDNLNQFNMLGDPLRNIWAIFDKDADWSVLEKARRYFKETAWPVSEIYYDFNAIERARCGTIAWSGTDDNQRRRDTWQRPIIQRRYFLGRWQDAHRAVQSNQIIYWHNRRRAGIRAAVSEEWVSGCEGWNE
jgi:hypothetical protein